MIASARRQNAELASGVLTPLDALDSFVLTQRLVDHRAKVRRVGDVAALVHRCHDGGDGHGALGENARDRVGKGTLVLHSLGGAAAGGRSKLAFQPPDMVLDEGQLAGKAVVGSDQPGQSATGQALAAAEFGLEVLEGRVGSGLGRYGRLQGSSKVRNTQPCGNNHAMVAASFNPTA